MQFAAIPGLPETKEKLLNAVKLNHLAHALLFHGPEGSANLTLALALASYLYCEQKSETDSCGTCGSCQRMNKLILPDLNFAFPVVASSKEEDGDGTERMRSPTCWATGGSLFWVSPMAMSTTSSTSMALKKSS